MTYVSTIFSASESLAHDERDMCLIRSEYNTDNFTLVLWIVDFRYKVSNVENMIRTIVIAFAYAVVEYNN